MSDDSDGAFPFAWLAWGCGFSSGGLTKREWFAGMALQGIAYAYASVKDDIGVMTPPIDFEKNLAKGAFSIADAMIAESEKE